MRFLLALIFLGIGCAVSAFAQLPVSGRPVQVLSQLDSIMTSFMTDPNRNISAGVLGVSRGGKVIFLHAYGSAHSGANLPETALFRFASVAKPITAAAIQRFAASGGLGPGNLQRYAFNLSGNGGILSVAPPGTPDPRCQIITIGHLLNHSAGWDRNQPTPGDIPVTRVREAGIDMNQPDALPTRRQLIDWALKYSLNYTPGAANYLPPGTITPVVPGVGTTYSNFGYLILGEVLAKLAPGGYMGYLQTEILSAANWIPSSEWGAATTLKAQNSAREPDYISTEPTYDSVFDYTPPIDKLDACYGGQYHLETMRAHGGLVISAQAMLRFGNLYSARYITEGAGATQSNDIGLPVSATGFAPGQEWFHTGSLPGVSSILRQRGVGAGKDDDEVISLSLTSAREMETTGQTPPPTLSLAISIAFRLSSCPRKLRWLLGYLGKRKPDRR